MNAGPGRRRPGLGYRLRRAADGPVRSAAPTPGPAVAGGAAAVAALAVTLGVAAACWVVAVREMTGMDMGTVTRLGSFGFFIAVWALAGVAVYALYRPHGTLAAGTVTVAAGMYEITPLKRHFRRRCRENIGSGLGFGLCCLGSSIGLMAMLVALGVMSIKWMAVIALVVFGQRDRLAPGQ